MSKFRARRTAVVSLVVALMLAVASPLGAQEVAALKAERPAALTPLYISFATLQGLDVHSTFRALGSGGRETNPMIGAVAGTPAGMVALKGGTAIGMIYLSEKLSKRNRTAAVLTMIGLNSAYAMIVAHNYSVANRR
jgi:hypothetical protein